MSDTYPRGVLVHEWVEQVGGSENVLEVLASLFPNSDLVCAWMNAPERFPNRRIIETSLARPPIRGRKALALPASVFAWRQLPRDGYQWALVSSHAFAHHARFRAQGPDFAKLVYVHSPARYVWNPELDARGSHPAIRAASTVLRRVDRRRASEATAIAANSAYVRERIRQHWGRDARVIFPPVPVEQIIAVDDWAEQATEAEQEHLARLPSEFVLGASRLIPYKRLDLVIAAAEAAGLPAVIAGDGPMAEELGRRAAVAQVPVTFLGKVSTAMLRALYQRASVYVFPATEDFGIMPVEAMAAGTPVVVNAVGGTAETVLDGTTGTHINDWTNRGELAEGVERARAVAATACRDQARTFAEARFAQHIYDWVDETLQLRSH